MSTSHCHANSVPPRPALNATGCAEKATSCGQNAVRHAHVDFRMSMSTIVPTELDRFPSRRIFRRWNAEMSANDDLKRWPALKRGGATVTATGGGHRWLAIHRDRSRLRIIVRCVGTSEGASTAAGQKRHKTESEAQAGQARHEGVLSKVCGQIWPVMPLGP